MIFLHVFILVLRPLTQKYFFIRAKQTSHNPDNNKEKHYTDYRPCRDLFLTTDSQQTTPQPLSTYIQTSSSILGEIKSKGIMKANLA